MIDPTVELDANRRAVGCICEAPDLDLTGIVAQDRENHWHECPLAAWRIADDVECLRRVAKYFEEELRVALGERDDPLTALAIVTAGTR